MNKTNKLVLCREDYKDQAEFENEIKKAIMLLLNAEYIMTVKYDDKGFGIIMIEYEHANEEYGCAYPYWLYPHEEESVIYQEIKMQGE